MGRIQQGYESKFRALLRQINASKVEQRVSRLLERAGRLVAAQGISHSQALADVLRRLQAQAERWRKWPGRQAGSSPEATEFSPTPRFLCDAGLGGLARWLRAAGYEAHWIADIDDDELLHEARRLGATLITTDSMLMERRVLRDGTLPAVWVPPSLTMLEQLRSVLDELHLPRRDPRCMDCGGELRKVAKEQLRERIPPRTYLWLDEYFVCQLCGKLFWHGTHWQNIQAQLQKLRK